MRREFQQRVRFGRFGITPAHRDEPDVYANVRRVRAFRWEWYLVTIHGVLTGPRYALTRSGALYKAVVTAQEVSR